jgi:hypothetical protein
MFAILTKGQYVESPLPLWVGQVRPAPLAEFVSCLKRYSPIAVFPFYRDAGYCLVATKDLDSAITHTLRTLSNQGIKYTSNSWDCEDFVNELHQTIRKMAAKAGLEFAPITCVISVKAVNEWAGVKPGGAHALASVMTELGPVVVETQNGKRCSIETYPNRAFIFEVSNL